MKILFITHYFQPEPMFFGLPFVIELQKRGHQVEVLTGYPNYPGGKIYDGYKMRCWQRQMMDGVSVVRLPLYPSHNQSGLKRFLCYASLALTKTIMGPWLTKKADIAYIVQGPATLGLPAIVMKWFKRIPFVYHIQDIWPDSLCSTGMFNNGFGMRLLHRWCNFVYKQATKIVVITPGMKQTLIDRGVPESKIDVVYNWCDQTLANSSLQDSDSLRHDLQMTDKFNIVFAGNMGAAQALDAVIDAAAIVQKQCPDIQFVFIGSGVSVDDLKKRAQNQNLNNVIFHPRKPVVEIGAILNLADVLLVHLRDDPLFSITIPSKTQAYMAIGKSILMAVKGDAANLVEKANAGIACQPQNPQSIADAAIRLRTMTQKDLVKMANNAKAFYNNEMDFPIAVSKLESIFRSTKY
ncbi:MAG: glycosyltransferase family 4 protein [Phycisphaerae bacterium]|nr:glycosyltransferase family 4 protein [Phycisphaerae bacterium]